MKNGINFGIPLIIFGAVLTMLNIWGLAIVLAGLVMVGATVIPTIKKSREIMRDTSNATQTATGGFSVVEGLIGVMITTIVGIGVVAKIITNEANASENITSNPLFGTVANILPTLIILLVLVVIVATVSGFQGD